MNGEQLYDQLYNDGYHSDLKLTHAGPLLREIHWMGYQYYFTRRINSVLDVGCSHGKAVQWLWSNRFIAEGVDISNTAVKLAKEARVHKRAPGNPVPRCIDKCFAQSSATRLPYGNQTFHAILSSDVLEHLEKQDMERAIYELARVAKRFLFLRIALTPESNKLPLSRLRAMNKNVPKNLHTAIATRETWNTLIEKNGFVVDHCVGSNSKTFLQCVWTRR